jgi:ubiquitin-like modifier-activating enzyme ATG7
MLRNLLVLVGQRWNLHEVQILCYRDVQSKRDPGRSLSIKLVSEQRHQDQPQVAPSTGQSLPRVTGWERNSKGKLLGRIVDLAAYMDPQRYEELPFQENHIHCMLMFPVRLANQAVDLNLKLIKWRISPKLDLDKIKNCSCLLLGAGTLGSYVARNLMVSYYCICCWQGKLTSSLKGWGVRKITFIDNGSVSFSNPVRQPLFVYQDCLNGGSKKATKAADALKEIYPGVESTGHVLSVPMPGHPTTDIEKTKAEYEHLEKLVLEHDAVFLLMDSRESRWLPTVMGKAAGKIVMNAALGFDTFVVMRHGVKASNESSVELGCYFCNDVVAPMDVSA